MIWTADNPAVAQNYIPATGGGMSSPVDQWSSDSENVSRFYSPHDSMITLLKQMGYGYPIDEELDNTGRYKSFRYKDRPAKMGELREYLRSLGYDPAQDRMLRSRFNNGVQEITPKDFRQMGRLFVHPIIRSTFTMVKVWVMACLILHITSSTYSTNSSLMVTMALEFRTMHSQRTGVMSAIQVLAYSQKRHKN